ncbi:hypothetical protein BT63DRAFT_441928 [Microthyrium microscopicum]|uniref:Uncharacterized protein n=1 Tax=Microthyrium microscopicum TaxID=703497 RepID=A0A6A6U3M4_9PEZI|nr:hypothetical protein BT63DRAFT_441928 [Microthyrium microscopicum]
MYAQSGPMDSPNNEQTTCTVCQDAQDIDGSTVEPYTDGLFIGSTVLFIEVYTDTSLASIDVMHYTAISKTSTIAESLRSRYLIRLTLSEAKLTIQYEVKKDKSNALTMAEQLRLQPRQPRMAFCHLPLVIHPLPKYISAVAATKTPTHP